MAPGCPSSVVPARDRTLTRLDVSSVRRAPHGVNPYGRWRRGHPLEHALQGDVPSAPALCAMEVLLEFILGPEHQADDVVCPPSAALGLALASRATARRNLWLRWTADRPRPPLS